MALTSLAFSLAPDPCQERDRTKVQLHYWVGTTTDWHVDMILLVSKRVEYGGTKGALPHMGRALRFSATKA